MKTMTGDADRKAKAAARVRKYYAKNRDAINEKARQKRASGDSAQTRWTKENPERVKESKRKYREASREKLREDGRKLSEKRKAEGYYRNWRLDNPEVYEAWYAEKSNDGQWQIESRLRAAMSPGRLKIIAACAPVTPEKFATLPWECQICGGFAEQIDHIFPKSRGGCSALHNLQWLCTQCNQRKFTHLMREFLPEAEYWAWADRTHSGGCVHVESGD